MKVIKNGKANTLDIHFDGEKGVYVGLTSGTAEWGRYGGTYISLSSEVAIELAKQILSKYKVKK
jgi:hypothetical protein